jgi:hypothetical protein
MARDRLAEKMPRKAVDPTPGPVSAAVHAERRFFIAKCVVVGITEAAATKCLTTAGRTLFHAAARVMDTAHRGVAVAAGEVDDPAFTPRRLGAPTDRLEQSVTNGDRVRQATGRRDHFCFALRADGHGDSFLSPHC